MRAQQFSVAAAAGIMLFSGCKHECGATIPSAEHTVVDLSWEGPTGTTWVEYGPTEDYGSATPTVEDEDREHTAELYGLTPLTDVFYRAVTEENGKEESCTGNIRTLGLPSGLPDIEISVEPTEEMSSEPYILGSIQGNPAALAVLDRDGNWLWYAKRTQDVITVGIEFANDGSDLLYNEFASDHGVDAGVIRRMALDGSVVSETRTELAHHVFTELPDGTLAFIAADIRDWTNPDTGDAESVVGDAIVEITPDGTSTTVFSVWDWFDVEADFGWDSGFYPQGSDWTHSNAIFYDAETDTYLLSLGHQRSVLLIDRTDFSLVRQYGRDSFPVVEGYPMYYQHDVQLTDDQTLLMFTSVEDVSASGAIEYEIDETDGVLREIWSFGLDGMLRAPMLGNVQRLANGNTLINYGGAGVIREVTPEGDIVWEARTGSGTWFGSARAFTDFYTGK